MAKIRKKIIGFFDSGLCALKHFVFLKSNKEKKVIIVLTEHLGDIVACEPVSRYAKSEYLGHKVLWVVNKKYQVVLKGNHNIDNVISLGCLSEWIFLKKLVVLFSNYKIIDLHIDKRRCTKYQFKNRNKNRLGITLSNYYNYGNLLESFSLASGISKLNDKPKLYLNEDDKPEISLPQNFIVIHTQSNEEERNWSVKKWNEVVNYIGEKFGYQVIEIGLQSILNNESDFYINLCGKLNLREYAFIISKSKCFIGVDSSFAHFANALDIKSLCLLGRYRIFEKYNPFSGVDSKIKILQHNDLLATLPSSHVINEINNLLND
jgi:heptosyltransferase-3